MNRIRPNANLPIVHADNEDQLNEAVSPLKQSPFLNEEHSYPLRMIETRIHKVI
jgi:hypothetical protein